MRLRLRRLLPVVVLLVLLGAPAAHAASDQASIMMDDDQLLYRGDRRAAQTLVRMKSLGADAVRATVLWRVVAELAKPTNAEIRRMRSETLRARARRQRARFKADNPRTYPARNWDRYDNLVKQAQRLGLRVYLTVTGPGPRWAHQTAPRGQRASQPTYKPKPSDFGDFVEAVGRRYSGAYRDENALRRPLPRVTLWSLWNEPNQPGWLTPQWERRGGQVVPAAPALYRRLYTAGYDALVRTRHGSDTILLGETSPLGSAQHGPRNGMRPGVFLRALAAAGGPPLRASGYAHHPYTRKRAPTIAPPDPDEYTIANIGQLPPLLDGLAAQPGGALPANMPLFLTEFGYESNPPDPRNGIPLLRQAQFNELAEFLAYNNPRVKATTQFLLRDAAPLRRFRRGSRNYWLTYQSGLLNMQGKVKPAAYAYALPFVIYAIPAAPGTVGFWGQLRFRNNYARDVAVIMWRPNPQSPYQQVGDPVPAGPRGFFQGSVPAPGPGGEYRSVYVDPATAKIVVSSLPASPKQAAAPPS